MHVRRFASAALAALVVLTGAACTGSAPTPAPSGHHSEASAPAFGATLDARAFADSIGPGVTVLDVRTPQEFATGHLEGAVLADVGGDFEAAVADLDRSAPYAVYCRSGNRSAAALEQMRALGFTDAWHLDGGIGAWQSAGLDVVAAG